VSEYAFSLLRAMLVRRLTARSADPRSVIARTQSGSGFACGTGCRACCCASLLYEHPQRWANEFELFR
jgi:hypothetical protein